jgi:perosamine synthetase
MTAFSFHPVKAITTGEGGMVTTDDADLAARIRRFRNHGIVTDARQREQAGTWFYEMQSLGFNYRICDIQCALGIQQLKKLDRWIARRQQVASMYEAAFSDDSQISTLRTLPQARHAYHLCVVRLPSPVRDRVFQTLRDSGIGVNVHYVPVHLHPFYRQRFQTGPGLCPHAELAYEQILSLPVYPGVTDEQVRTVIGMIRTATGQSRKAA